MGYPTETDSITEKSERPEKWLSWMAGGGGNVPGAEGTEYPAATTRSASSAV